MDKAFFTCVELQLKKFLCTHIHFCRNNIVKIKYSQILLQNPLHFRFFLKSQSSLPEMQNFHPQLPFSLSAEIPSGLKDVISAARLGYACTVFSENTKY